ECGGIVRSRDQACEQVDRPVDPRSHAGAQERLAALRVEPALRGDYAPPARGPREHLAPSQLERGVADGDHTAHLELARVEIEAQAARVHVAPTKRPSQRDAAQLA